MTDWRQVEEGGNEEIWTLVSEPAKRRDGARTNPYWESGSHPDVVEFLWDKVGAGLGADCRARARDCPVLATPAGDRIFAKAHGTTYVIWLCPEDLPAAIADGYATRHAWFGGRFTELTTEVGPGWVWGRYRDIEREWLRRSLERLEGNGAAPA